MTLAQFIAEMTAYYGQPYPEGMRKRVGEYLAQFSDRALDRLADLTFKTFSSRYKSLPDIAAWESVRKEVRAELDESDKADLTRPRLEYRETLTEAEREEASRILDNAKQRFPGAHGLAMSALGEKR